MREIVLVAWIFAGLQAISADETLCMRKGMECPNYNVLETKEGYEERDYDPSVWVSVSDKLSEAEGLRPVDLYMKLFRYIKGRNSLGAPVPRTTPVRVLIDKSADTITMSFFLPKYLHSSPPKPLEDGVFISREPSRKYIARTFGGIDGRKGWVAERKQLMDALGSRSDFDGTRLYEVVYDRPSAPLEQQINEIWVELKEKK